MTDDELSNLKIGDQVKCIDDFLSKLCLKGGYTVVDINECGGVLRVAGKSKWFSKGRFEVVKTQPIAGATKTIHPPPLGWFEDGGTVTFRDGVETHEHIKITKLSEDISKPHNPMYCSCGFPILKVCHQASFGGNSQSETYNICTTCKKEHI